MAAFPPANGAHRRSSARTSLGAARRLRRRGEPDRTVKTHCCFCGQQCGVQLLVKDERVVGVEPWEEFPFNGGKLCPKGIKRYLQNNHPDRLLRPLVRTGRGFAPIPGTKRSIRWPSASARSRRSTAGTPSPSSRARRSPTRRRT